MEGISVYYLARNWGRRDEWQLRTVGILPVDAYLNLHWRTEVS
jgi:hypothetical protein